MWSVFFLNHRLIFVVIVGVDKFGWNHSTRSVNLQYKPMVTEQFRFRPQKWLICRISGFSKQIFKFWRAACYDRNLFIGFIYPKRTYIIKVLFNTFKTKYSLFKWINTFKILWHSSKKMWNKTTTKFNGTITNQKKNGFASTLVPIQSLDCSH